MEPSAARHAAACDAFCESLRSERAWRNVQPVLLASFTSVAQLLTAQAQELQALHEQVSLLQTSIGATDARVEGLVSERITQALEPYRQQQQATEIRVLARVEERFVTKEAAGATAKSQCVSLEQQCDKVGQNVQRQVAEWERAVESEWRESLRKAVAEQAEAQRQQMRTEQRQKREDMKQAVLTEVMDSIQSQLHEKRSAPQPQPSTATTKCLLGPEHDDDLDESVHRDLDRVAQELQSIEAKLAKQLTAWRHELTLSINKKPCRSEVAKLLDRKMDSLEAWKQLAEKADSARVEEVSGELTDTIERAQETAMRDLEQMQQRVNSKADVHDTVQLKQNLHELLCVVESLQHESSGLRAAMSRKMSVEDATQLVDSRTTLVGLESAIKQMESAIAADFSTKRDFQGVAQQVHAIKQQLRSEMYQARYIWKDGRPSAKQTIAWNTQVVNTNADVFVWKAGSDRVMLKIPGLYHLQAAFFTDFAPTIQVLINGEPGLVLAGDEDAVVAASAPNGGSTANSPRRHASPAVSGFKRVHHSAGNVVGLAVDAFLALPARAVVQISYDIDEKAQGFLNLRKL